MLFCDERISRSNFSQTKKFFCRNNRGDRSQATRVHDSHAKIISSHWCHTVSAMIATAIAHCHIQDLKARMSIITEQLWFLGLFAALCLLCGWLSLIDIQRGIIPDQLNLLVAVLGLIKTIGGGGPADAIAACCQAAIIGALFWLLRRLYFSLAKGPGPRSRRRQIPGRGRNLDRDRRPPHPAVDRHVDGARRRRRSSIRRARHEPSDVVAVRSIFGVRPGADRAVPTIPRALTPGHRADRQQADVAVLATGLRQGQYRRPVILAHGHFAALNDHQPPALMIVADLQAQCRLARLIDEDSKTFVGARDGADQRKLGRFDFLFARRWPTAVGSAAIATGAGRRDGEKIGRSRVPDNCASGSPTADWRLWHAAMRQAAPRRRPW